jgi:signal transduction histidine kinase/ligand-binding sensor domain-containing protein
MHRGHALLWICSGLIGSVCAFASVAPGRETPLDEPGFAAIGNAESIPDGVVSSLAEDALGMIWIGSPAGLIRYDGYRFRFHVHDPNNPRSIGGNFIRSLLVARDGRIWAGTEADGLSAYDPLREEFTVFRNDPARADSIAAGAVTALAEAADGAIWVGKRGGGLSRLAPGAQTFQHFGARVGSTAAPDDDRIQALLVDRQDTLWVGTWNGLTRRRAGAGEFEPVQFGRATADALVGKTIWCLFEARDGRIWVGTQQGDLAIVDPRTAVAQLVTQHPGEGDRTSTIYSAVQPNVGEIWVGRATGIDVRDAATGNLLRRLRHDPARPTSLASNEVRALFLDRAHLVWVGGYGGGVQRHDPSHRSLRVRRHDPGHGGVFGDPNVRSLLELADGRILAGTQEHGVAVFDAQLRLIDGYALEPGNPLALQGGRVGGLAQTADGAIWIGTDSGLYRRDPVRAGFTVFHPGKGRTRRLFAGRDGELWIATEDGLYRKSPVDEVIVRMVAGDGSSINGDINAIVQFADGRIWVGGESGLYQTTATAKELRRPRVVVGSELAHPTVIGLLLDHRGVLWVDTALGLHRMSVRADGAVAFERSSVALGIGGRPFGANLLEDSSGRVWTHEFMFDPANGQVHELTRADGVDFGTGWFRAYAKTRDGRLLFGGSKGLLVVEPSGFTPWSYQPPLIATELKVDGQLLPVGSALAGLKLAPEQRGFSVEFAALDLSAPERNRYAYKLEGFDPDWTATDANYRVATYSNLWPGDYLMRVRGSNRTGAFSPHELAMPVHVLPAFWQTWWFAVLAAIAWIALVTAGFRMRTARIRRQAQELQQLVDGRTAELRAAKERAESALGELQGTQRQLVEAEKMASLGGLVAGIAHEINTPIGIAVTAATHLQEASRLLVARIDAKELKASELPLFRDNVNESMRLILGSLERALRLITSFKKVAVDQSSEQRRRFELRGFLEDVRTALHPTYKTTAHRLHVDCPAGVEIDTYPGALFQIITNLINNSLIHGFAEHQAGHMSLEAALDGDAFVLRYSDDGVGMPAAIAARAFEPFFTTKRGSGGSGLGLHVVFNLVTQMLGGRIDLETAPGKGCTFVLRMPLSAPERPARPLR